MEPLEQILAAAINRLASLGQIGVFINPDLTGAEKSVSYFLDIGNIRFEVESIVYPENKLVFYVDGELVSEEVWAEALDNND